MGFQLFNGMENMIKESLFFLVQILSYVSIFLIRQSVVYDYFLMEVRATANINTNVVPGMQVFCWVYNVMVHSITHFYICFLFRLPR